MLILLLVLALVAWRGFTAWFKASTTSIVIDGSGNVVDCATCPCASGVTVACCANTFPTVLTVTVSARTGTCTCLPASFTMTWNGVSQWDSAAGLGTCVSAQFHLSCTGAGLANFNFTSTACGVAVAHPSAGSTCSPISLVFTALTLSACCAGTATFTITP